MKWIPTICFRKLLSLKKRMKAIYGGSSAGKTVAIIPYLYQKAAENPGEVITIISDTLANLKKGAIRDFKNILVSTDVWDHNCWLKSESTYHLNNGSIIEFVGADDETKLRGPRRQRCYINEANRIKYEVFDQVNMRTEKEMILDWNPSGPFWYNQYIMDILDHDALVVNFKDNESLSEEQLQIFSDMEAQSKLSEFHMNKWRVYGLGEWGTLEGACIKSYEIIHNIPIDFELIGIGLDFGSVDANAAVALYKDNQGRFLFDEILYKNEEAYEGKPMLEGIYDDICNYYSNDVHVYADYAAYGAISYLQRLGLRGVRKCRKGPDSIKNGIDLINEKRPFVTKRSTNLLEEFGLYRYKTDKDGNLVEGKYEGPDHLVDACRYVLSSNIKKKQFKIY